MAQVFLCKTATLPQEKYFHINCSCHLCAIQQSFYVRVHFMHLVMVYVAMLSVAQPEHGVCDMHGKISGMNSPYQNKGKYSYLFAVLPDDVFTLAFRFLNVQTLKNPSEFSSQLKIKISSPPSVWYLSNHEQLPPRHLKLCDNPPSEMSMHALI